MKISQHTSLQSPEEMVDMFINTESMFGLILIHMMAPVHLTNYLRVLEGLRKIIPQAEKKVPWLVLETEPFPARQGGF